MLDVRRDNIGLPDDRKLLSRSVDAGVVKRGDVVNGGYIVRSKLFSALEVIAGMCAGPQPGLQAEVVEPANGEYHALEGHGDGGVGAIGVVLLAANIVAVNPDAKGAADLAGSAAEGNRIARAGDGLEGKTMLA